MLGSTICEIFKLLGKLYEARSVSYWWNGWFR